MFTCPVNRSDAATRAQSPQMIVCILTAAAACHGGVYADWQCPTATISGKTVGDGILLQGSTMTLSGSGVNSGVTVLDQLSSSGSESTVAGVYKINYNPNTAVQTINDYCLLCTGDRGLQIS